MVKINLKIFENCF